MGPIRIERYLEINMFYVARRKYVISMLLLGLVNSINYKDMVYYEIKYLAVLPFLLNSYLGPIKWGI